MMRVFTILMLFSTTYVNAQWGEPVYRQEQVQVQPEYPGGLAALYEHLNSEFRWPQDALKAGATGKVVVGFIVERDGRLSNMDVIQDRGHGTGYALIQALRNSYGWRPGMYRGRDVRVYYVLAYMLPPLPGNPNVKPPDLPQQSVLSDAQDKEKTLKIQPLTVTPGRYLFPEKHNDCVPDSVIFDGGRQALSDRYSVVDAFVRNIQADSLKSLTGRVAFQMLIDTAGRSCVVSLKSELNMPTGVLNLPSFVNNIKWNFVQASGKNQPVSAILVFTIAEDEVKYQRFVVAPEKGLKETEVATKGKFTRY